MIIFTFMYAYILYIVYHLQQNHGRGKKGLSHSDKPFFSCRGALVGRPFTQNLIYKYPTYTCGLATCEPLQIMITFFRPSIAVRFSNRLTIPYNHDLTDDSGGPPFGTAPTNG